MEKIMAVYDIDPLYAERFADVVNRKEKAPFTVVPFTSVEALKDYGEKHRIEILLVSESVPAKQLAGIKAGSVVTLSEGDAVPSADSCPSVYKYQSADSLVREVMAKYCDRPPEELFAMAGRRAKVFGVYSPLGRCMKTSFALTLGQELTREGKTLYLSFEEFSGFSQMFREEYENDLSDVLYFLRQGGFNVVRLRSMVYTWKDLDYIAPVRYPEDLEQMDGMEAADLLERLASEAGYGYVVLDMGRPAKNLAPILENCDVIYMPVREDFISVARLAEFDRYLEETGRERLRDRIRKVKLPFHGSIRQNNYMDQLQWGEMGDYVRKLLRGAAAAE